MARKRNQNTAAENQVETVNADETTDADMAALQAILDDDGGAQNLEIALDDDPGEDLTPEEIEAAERAIESDKARAESYAGQESSLDVVDETEDKPAKTAGASKGGTRVAKPKGEFADVVAAMFASEPAVLDSEEGELSEDALKQAMLEVRQKKVQEKVVNILQHVTQDAKLSVYTEIALKLLVDAYLNGGDVKLSEIKSAYEAKGYKAGTVGAQSGQMMSLFPALSMASKPERGTLKPNSNSVLLDMLASK